MAALSFRPNAWPTLGVEIELALVETGSLALASAVSEILDTIPPALHDSVKPEFLQCYVELNTDICRTADEVGGDLAAKVRTVEAAAQSCGIELLWAGTHPFSRWRDQQVTPNERYYKLADFLQETVIRPVTFGLHVHVGVPSGDVGIAVMNRLHGHLPTLLALSANSPFWQGRLTGHHAHRIDVLEGAPTGGLPPRLGSWDEYQGLIGQLQRAGFIESHRELWWDVRPNAENGTVEVRICDMPPDLTEVVQLTALIQCLVQRLVRDVTEGRPEPECHPLIHRQNRWRAFRFGLGAPLVNPVSLEPVPAREAVTRLIAELRPEAEALGATGPLEVLAGRIEQPSGAEQQIARFEQTDDLVAVTRALVQRSRLLPADPHAAAAVPPAGARVDGPAVHRPSLAVG